MPGLLKEYGAGPDPDRIAGYVLGLLDPEDRARIDMARGTDAAVDEAIAFWEDRLGVLLTALPPAAPPDDLWDRIDARIDAIAGRFVGVDTLYGAETRWTPIAPGIRQKAFRTATGDGTRHLLLSIEPGATIPIHPHVHAEECVVLSGEVTLGPFQLRAGDVHVAAAGTTHAPIVSATGAVLYIRYAA